MKEFTQVDARRAIMDMTQKAFKAFNLSHSGELVNESYLDARLAYINSVLLETIPAELRKMAV